MIDAIYLSLIRLTEKGPALKEREMEEIWEEGAELELVRRTSPSISDAAWVQKGGQEHLLEH